MLRAIVVGGGIAGLSASVALRRAGHIVHVYEKTQLDNEVGAAINVPPNAARFLVGQGTGSWGLDPVRSRFVKATTLEWCDPFTTAAAKPPSESRATILLSHANNAARYGAELWLAHRVDLHAALRRLATQAADDGDKVPAAPPVTIHPNAQVVHYVCLFCHVLFCVLVCFRSSVSLASLCTTLPRRPLPARLPKKRPRPELCRGCGLLACFPPTMLTRSLSRWRTPTCRP